MKLNIKYIYPVVTCLLWGSAYVSIKLMYQFVGGEDTLALKFLLAGIRFTLAGGLLLVYYIIKNKKLPFEELKGKYKKATIFGFFGIAVMYGIYYIGIYYTSSVKTAILFELNIFLAVIISHFLFDNDKLSVRKVVGLILGFSGIILINMNGVTSDNLFSFSFMGEGFIIISTSIFALVSIGVKKWGTDINPVVLNIYQLILGGGILLVLGLVMNRQRLRFNTSAILILLYLGLVSGVAFTLWYYSLSILKASNLFTLRFLIPIFGTMFSVILMPSEKLTFMTLISLVLISYGIYLCFSTSRRKVTSDS